MYHLVRVHYTNLFGCRNATLGHVLMELNFLDRFSENNQIQ